MSDGCTIRRYRRRTDIRSVNADRWRNFVLIGIITAAGLLGMLAAFQLLGV